MTGEELAAAIEQLDAKASKAWQVHRCGECPADKACGICSDVSRHPNWAPCAPHHASNANIMGDLSYDECHHPASQVDMELAILLRNNAEAIVEALRKIEAIDAERVALRVALRGLQLDMRGKAEAIEEMLKK